MGDLRDQLRQARLLSKKDSKRLAHEERLERTKLGGSEGVEKDRDQHRAELRLTREDGRRADREAQLSSQAVLDASAERAACVELLRSEVRTPSRGGGTRFYFELPDGSLPSLNLAVHERMQLQDGSLCIVRVGPKGSHDYGLLSIGHGRRVAEVFPGRVAWAAASALG